MNDEDLFFDTSVLSNFARIERLSLLWKFSKKIYTTKEVIEEVEKGVEKRPELKSIIEASKKGKIQLVSVKNMENMLFMGELKSEGVLGKGEISLIGVAKELGGIFITDDEGATNKAKNINIKVLHGKEFRATVVILKTLLEQAHIDKIEYGLIRQSLIDKNFKF